MQKVTIVTFLVSCVLTLGGGYVFSASVPKHLQKPKVSTTVRPAVLAALGNKVVLSADQAIKIEEKNPDKKFSGAIALSRGRSLVDYQDGSRTDSMEYLFIPRYELSIGSVSSKLGYDQDLKDDAPEASTFKDASITFAKMAYKWEWSPPYILTLTPTLTAIVPLSRNSTKRDQLQTALIAGVSLGIIPDGLYKETGFSLAIGLTAGRNFHQYEESLGRDLILNRYSSNQTLNLGYSYKQFSFGIEYIHRSRFSYQNTTKDSFVLSEEIGYAINDTFSVALGHSNDALTGLEANGSEPSFKFIDENASTVYAQLGISF